MRERVCAPRIGAPVELWYHSPSWGGGYESSRLRGWLARLASSLLQERSVSREPTSVVTPGIVRSGCGAGGCMRRRADRRAAGGHPAAGGYTGTGCYTGTGGCYAAGGRYAGAGRNSIRLSCAGRGLGQYQVHPMPQFAASGQRQEDRSRMEDYRRPYDQREWRTGYRCRRGNHRALSGLEVSPISQRAAACGKPPGRRVFHGVGIRPGALAVCIFQGVGHCGEPPPLPVKVSC